MANAFCVERAALPTRGNGYLLLGSRKVFEYLSFNHSDAALTLEVITKHCEGRCNSATEAGRAILKE